MEIADSPCKTRADGSIDPGDVKSKRLRINARMWLLERRLPHIYGRNPKPKKHQETSFTIKVINPKAERAAA